MIQKMRKNARKKFGCRGSHRDFLRPYRKRQCAKKRDQNLLNIACFVPIKTMRRAAALHIVYNCVSRSPSQRFKMIPGLAKALFAILDGLCGTVADAGHAVGAVLPPDGFPVLQGDVVGGAAPDALPAAGAGVPGGKGICLYKAGIEDGIHRPARQQPTAKRPWACNCPVVVTDSSSDL